MNKPNLRKILFIALTVLAAAAALALILLSVSARKSCYEAGLKLTDAKHYDEAKEAFSSLGSYSDSSSQALYADAMAKLEAGDYRAAGDIFTQLGDFRSSGELAAAAYNYADYEEAKALIDEGKYDSALTLLKGIESSGIDGTDKKILLCSRNLEYDEAEKLLSQGRKYDAFKKFLSVSEIRDAGLRARDCVEEMPKSSELYHNPDFESNDSVFYVKSKTDTYAVFRVYSEDGTLVSTLFVNPGETVEIKVPDGKYYLHRGFGETWFGPEDLFGDEGRYLEFSQDGESIFTFASGSSYILTEVSYGHEYGTDKLTRDTF